MTNSPLLEVSRLLRDRLVKYKADHVKEVPVMDFIVEGVRNSINEHNVTEFWKLTEKTFKDRCLDWKAAYKSFSKEARPFLSALFLEAVKR